MKEESGASVGESIRRAINEYLKVNGKEAASKKTERKRAATRKRS